MNYCTSKYSQHTWLQDQFLYWIDWVIYPICTVYINRLYSLYLYLSYPQSECCGDGAVTLSWEIIVWEYFIEIKVFLRNIIQTRAITFGCLRSQWVLSTDNRHSFVIICQIGLPRNISRYLCYIQRNNIVIATRSLNNRFPYSNQNIHLSEVNQLLHWSWSLALKGHKLSHLPSGQYITFNKYIYIIVLPIIITYLRHSSQHLCFFTNDEECFLRQGFV